MSTPLRARDNEKVFDPLSASYYMVLTAESKLKVGTPLVDELEYLLLLLLL